MNYRHQYHAGNFADVMKHALLVQLIRSLQQKEKGFLFVDTHAGRGAYDLKAGASGLTLERTPEWPEGIGRLWDRTDLSPELADYLGLVKAYNIERGHKGPLPRFYPGSPTIARLLRRPQDRIALYEQHPEEAQSLGSRFNERGISVEQADGYRAAAALLPPPERRGLMLIDPPFEAADEWKQIAGAVQNAFERLESAVIAVWYPIADRANRRGFTDFWEGGALPPTLAAELIVAPGDPGLQGCGLLVFNPPWRFDQKAKTLGDALAT